MGCGSGHNLSVSGSSFVFRVRMRGSRVVLDSRRRKEVGDLWRKIILLLGWFEGGEDVVQGRDEGNLVFFIRAALWAGHIL